MKRSTFVIDALTLLIAGIIIHVTARILWILNPYDLFANTNRPSACGLYLAFREVDMLSACQRALDDRTFWNYTTDWAGLFNTHLIAAALFIGVMVLVLIGLMFSGSTKRTQNT